MEERYTDALALVDELEEKRDDPQYKIIFNQDGGSHD